MKNMKNLLLIAIAILGFSAVSFAQTQNATASTTASIVNPLTIAKTTDMNFGPVLAGSTGGKVILNFADGRSYTGTGVSGIAGTGGSAPKSAVFTITGTGTSAYSIVIPIAPITMSGTTTGLTVDAFLSDSGLTGNLAGGTMVIKIGATLNLPTGAIVAGTYTNASDLSVTVAYN